MKINKVYKVNLLSLIIVFLVYIITKLILNGCNLELRKWLDSTILVLITILLFSFIIQTLIKLIIYIKHTATVKKRLGILLLIILVIFLGIRIIMYDFIYMIFNFAEKEYIIKKNDKKEIAIVNHFMNINIRYYDYQNLFVRSNILKREKNVDLQNSEEINSVLKYLQENN